MTRGTNSGHLARNYRRETAIQRDEARLERSPQQQLTMLDDRLGKGKGASRERARLKQLITKQKANNKRVPTHSKE